MTVLRVTDRLLIDKVLANIQRNTQRLANLQQQVATGRRLEKPSDDPTGTVTSLVLHSIDDENAQAQKNLSLADGWLTSTDVALQDVNDILKRARELAVQGANETLGPEETAGLANEIDQLIGHALQLSNTRNGDRYIFGGFNTRTQPFELQPDPVTGVDTWIYNGDNGEILRHVGPGVKIGVNITGDRVFPQVFDVLIALRDDLRNGDQDSISLNRLDEIDAVQNDVLDAVGEIGAKGSRLELTSKQLSASRLNDAHLISMTEDVDMSRAILNLSAQQAALQAALATGARVLQTKLIDFLR